MSGTAPVSRPLAAAAALALSAAVSLGLARFSYALLLPPMRADLGWSYLTAGAMNTANAAGYLVGALLLPALLRRIDARTLMLAGGFASALLLVAHAAVRSDIALLLLRSATGVASAAAFATGGLLAARLAGALPPGSRVTPGQVLGLYYGGTGVGIVASSLVVPPLPWPAAWIALGAVAALASVLTAAGTRALRAPPSAGAPRVPVRLAPLAWALAGYGCFGLGYIGYMTFVVTLLREQGLGSATVVAFYVLLGLGVVASSWLWAPLLQRWRGGQTLALLNGLLALATLLAVLPAWWALGTAALPLVFASGALFGSVFLSVVASTTALVRHNLPAAAWPAGIAAFTIVFAAGQIVGPSLVGALADRGGGLVGGFVLSAGLLALGALLALRQRPLH
ncbi:MAG: YbfB/YjiJ family MFS transporter [Rubrivivax sp.]|nr:YbfB/YjiJ family MFS transporter [Rubrivivax sp.]